jgi:phosphatidyl-myo-inositol alpha-mannosyltransferase
MKVCFVTSHAFLKPGGVKNHILELSEEYRKRGIEVKIITPRRNKEENYGEDIILLGKSIPIRIAGTQGDFAFVTNPKEINSILEKEKFNVLHFHNFVIPYAFQILNRSKSLNILTFHANVEAIPFSKISIPLFKFFIKKIHGVIGVAPMIMEYFKDFKGKKQIIPNGINLKIFNPNNPKFEKYIDGKINLLFVGRIEERKGLLYLLKSYKIVKEKNDNVRLIVVGEGPLRKQCEEYIKENNLKDVVFEGQKTGEDVARFYSTCDIYISPAHFGESFGIVLLEAMASQKPVVGFANLGYYQLLKGTKGEQFLAKPRDIEEMAQKILILVNDENLRKEMGDWGLEHSKNYSWDKIADRVLEFYKSSN